MESVNFTRIMIQITQYDEEQSGEDVTIEVPDKASKTCDSHVSSQTHLHAKINP